MKLHCSVLAQGLCKALYSVVDICPLDSHRVHGSVLSGPCAEVAWSLRIWAQDPRDPCSNTSFTTSWRELYLILLRLQSQTWPFSPLKYTNLLKHLPFPWTTNSSRKGTAIIKLLQPHKTVATKPSLPRSFHGSAGNCFLLCFCPLQGKVNSGLFTQG